MADCCDPSGPIVCRSCPRRAPEDRGKFTGFMADDPGIGKRMKEIMIAEGRLKPDITQNQEITDASTDN